ncbi:hypothetical protein FRC03_000523 [Tulasnella sp. 419]|nr:hypothetical protein FRC02_003829 [Tulasnella sp. 418]KAG8948987.1 hypothetical protein FRC03_000523 [Tulasnella sp. 419]
MYLSWLTINFLYWLTMLAPWVMSTPQEIFPNPLMTDEPGCPKGFGLELGSKTRRAIMDVWSRLGVHLPSQTNYYWRINDRDMLADSYMTYVGEVNGSCQYGIMVKKQQVAVAELFIGRKNKAIYLRRLLELNGLQTVYDTFKRQTIQTKSGDRITGVKWIIRRPYVNFPNTAGALAVKLNAHQDSRQMMFELLKHVSEHVAQTVQRWCSIGYVEWSNEALELTLEDFLFPVTFPYDSSELAISHVHHWVDLRGNICDDARAKKAYLDAKKSIDTQLGIRPIFDSD